jgi:serine/threonine-protein kinase HipA
MGSGMVMRPQKLIVAMNAIEVGTLFRDGRGAMSFQYLSSWLDRPGARAISLSLPLTSKKQESTAVYNFFNNLLPDSDIIITRMQQRFQIATNHPFDLLAAIGRDCVGAIQLYPEDIHLSPINEVHAEPLDENTIAKLLSEYKTSPLGMDNTHDFRISIAGAQEKTALLWYQGQWQRPLGSTPTSHIFKLPIGMIEQNNIDLSESCENEWLCLQIAKAFGFNVANTELATFNDTKVLVVERFDRRWSSDNQWLMRLPQEDMSQALGYSPALKYESHGGPGIAEIMKLLLGSRLSTKDRETFFRSQILYWLLAAIDGHAKNFSIFIEPNTSFVMTPLYDVISAYPIFKSKGIPPQKAKMAMALQGKNKQYLWSKIQPRHFQSTAQHVGFSSEQAEYLLQEMVMKTTSVIREVEQQLSTDFPSHISDSIFEGLEKQARAC